MVDWNSLKSDVVDWFSLSEDGPDDSQPKKKTKAPTVGDRVKSAAESVGRGVVKGATFVADAVVDPIMDTPDVVGDLVTTLTGGKSDPDPEGLRVTNAVQKKVVEPLVGKKKISSDPVQRKTDQIAEMVGEFLVPLSPVTKGRIIPHVVESVLGGAGAVVGGDVAEKALGPNGRIVGEVLGGGGGVVAGAKWTMPVDGKVTSGPGKRKAPTKGASTNHAGVDLKSPTGTPVKAPTDGTVTKVGRNHAARGNWVEMKDAEGNTHRFLHLSGYNVKPGMSVKEGQLFARVGATGRVTGPHLHWSVHTKDGKRLNPLEAAKGEHIAPDGLPGNQTVRPMAPEEIARIMDDMDAADAADVTPPKAPDNEQPILPDEGTLDFDSVIEKARAGRDINPQEQALLNSAGIVQDPRSGVWMPRDKAYDLGFEDWSENNLSPLPNNNISEFPQNRQVGSQLTPDEIAEQTAAGLPSAEVMPFDPDFARAKREGRVLTPEQEIELQAKIEETSQTPGKWTPPENMKTDADYEAELGGGGGQQPPREPPSGGGGGDGTPPPGGRGVDPAYEGLDPEQKLIKALKAAKPLTGKQKNLQHEARVERARKLHELQSRGASLPEQLASQKGELPNVEYESILHNFTPEDVKRLGDKVNFNNWLQPFEKLTAHKALMKLLGAEGIKPPTPGEIKLLSHIFSEDFVKALLSHRTFTQKFWDTVGQVANLPRAFMASMDFSAPFRQGLFLIRKKEFWKNIPKMFEVFANKKAFDDLQVEIRSRPTADLMRRANLAITDNAHFMSNREEDFISALAEKIPLAGKVISASNRAYTGFLIKLRADTFDSLIELGRITGKSWETDPKALKDLGHFINASTGRGSLNTPLGSLEGAAPLLTAMFFSPRLISSRLTLLNPYYYATLEPFVRKEAIKNLAALSAIATTALGLAAMNGAEVETDMKSADFAKIKIGDTRYDILGGFQQYLVLGSRLWEGETTTAKGAERSLTSGKFGQDTRLDVLTRFIINKFSPTLSYFTDAMRGTNPIGEEFDAGKDALKRFIPLVAQDIAEMYKEGGFTGALAGFPAIFGTSVQTYKPKEAKTPPPTGGQGDPSWDSLSSGTNSWESLK